MKMKKTPYSCFETRGRGFNPIKSLKRWVRNVKRAYHRIRYGYCDMDVWSIDWWFLNVVPNMLEDLKNTVHGYPSEFNSIPHALEGIDAQKEVDEACMKRWKATLSEIIFLLREANEDTCTRENKYEEEYRKAQAKFTEKYGVFGEGLKTEEEKEGEKKKASSRIYMLGDVPEYEEIDRLHFEEYKDICDYRDECKDKGLDMFKKWFWNLWD